MGVNKPIVMRLTSNTEKFVTKVIANSSSLGLAYRPVCESLKFKKVNCQALKTANVWHKDTSDYQVLQLGGFAHCMQKARPVSFKPMSIEFVTCIMAQRSENHRSRCP